MSKQTSPITRRLAELEALLVSDPGACAVRQMLRRLRAGQKTPAHLTGIPQVPPCVALSPETLRVIDKAMEDVRTMHRILARA